MNPLREPTEYELGYVCGLAIAAGEVGVWHNHKVGTQDYRDWYRGYEAATKNT